MKAPGKRSFVLRASLLALCLAVPAARAARRRMPLLVGELLDDTGRPRGIRHWQRELFSQLERELDISFDIRMYPWPRAELNARQGAGLIFGLPRTDERESALRFSDPAVSGTLWLVTRSDATFPFHGMEDLRGKTVGAVRGYGYGEEFERARNKLFRVEDDVASRSMRLQRLLMKRVDAVLLYESSLLGPAEIEAKVRQLMASHLREQPGLSFSVLPAPLLASAPQHFAIARDRDDGLIDRINAALARLHKQGARADAGQAAARMPGAIAR